MLMRKKKNQMTQVTSFDIIMTSIPTGVYVLFVLLPCLVGLVVSFTNFGGYSLEFKWVKFYQYQKMFTDPVFYKSIVNYVQLYIGTIIVCFPLAMLAAIALTRNLIKEKNFYRILFFFPSTVPFLIIAIMWMVMYNPSFGVLNQFLGLFGVDPVNWLGSSKTVMPAIIFMVVWRQFGFYMVYFIAGISNIPESLYESARIDGASETRQVFSITIPLMWEVIRTSLIFYIQSAAGIGFNIIYIATRGGPDNASQFLPSYMYLKITDGLDYGYSAALATALLVVTMVMALIILRVTRREIYEY